MRLARFQVDGQVRLGLPIADGLIEITGRLCARDSSMISVIAKWKELEMKAAALTQGTPDFLLKDVRLLAPIERPGKILGIGLNYSDHTAEAGVAPPSDQLWFSKLTNSTNGPYEPILLPTVSEQLDYEGEMVFVIGRTCKHVSIADAHNAIFGFMVGNDVSVRDWQLRTSQFLLGKSFDSHAPMGPWITTTDEVDFESLNITTSVNGEVRQQSNTRHLIFNCAAQIAHVSSVMTLEPGDVIFTGTPGGVGGAFKPPKWLREGDRVEVTIDKLGSIANTVVRESVISSQSPCK